MDYLRDTLRAQSPCRCVNVANFVSDKLGWEWDGKSHNYKSWKEQMLCLIESEGLLHFIISPSPPPDETLDDFIVWRRTDRQVKGWILGVVTREIAETIAPLNTAKDVWLELEKKFTQPQGSSAPPPPPPEQGSDRQDYLSVRLLYRATVRGDWDEAKRILEQDPTTAYAQVGSNLETPLHTAVGTGKTIHFVENLVRFLTNDQLELKSQRGYNALHVAAMTGNTAAARILVARLPNLLYLPNNSGNFPVHTAALFAQRDTLDFLISETKDDGNHNPYAGENGVWLLIAAINADFLDIAMNLANKYPHMAMINVRSGSALDAIALKESAFYSGARFNFWERLIYRGLAWLGGAQQCSEASEMHPATTRPNPGDIEDHCVPCVKGIHDKKIMHQRALELVKCLCKHMDSLSDKDVLRICTDPLIHAAKLGVHEVVEVIVETFPDAMHSHYYITSKEFFAMAVQNRCEKVWNLIYQANGHIRCSLDVIDADGSTLLHCAATLAPPHKLNLVSGAALQMQREIQWFKEVQQRIPPNDLIRKNNAGKTPEMIFTEEHKNLKADGEKWMKDTANSCTIAAALIATVGFAAAITVPGGNKSDIGYPLFSKSSAFIIFAISDAISLFTSTTSLLMFLSILTSRYAEEDFLYALPKRLCIGLVTLFVSISFMIAAFSATIFLVFGRKHEWVLIPVAALACLPVSSFVLLQFPLLVDVISSTYGPGIFGKQSDRPFY